MGVNAEDAAVIKQLLETAKKLKEQAVIAARADQHELSSAFAHKAEKLEDQANSLFKIASL